MLQAEKHDTRITYLDSWRGIAALFVFIYHMIIELARLFRYKGTLDFKLYFVFNGTDWVSFFFVLSGFALSYSYIVGDKKLSAPDFYIKRIFRIYPVYLLALALDYMIRRQSGPYSNMNLLEQALLFPRYTRLLITGWSLSVELYCSLLMPMIIAFALSYRSQFWLLALASLLLYNITGSYQGGAQGFIFHFFLGTGLALLLKQSEVNNKKLPLSSLSRPKVVGMLIVAYILFTLRYFSLSWHPLEYILWLLTSAVNLSYYNALFYFSGVASFILILLTLGNKPFQKILSISPLVFLGRISFGIYLLHMPLIRFVFPKLLGIADHSWLSVLFILAGMSIALIAFSYLTYIVIELPFIQLSKRVIFSAHYLRLKSKVSAFISR